MDDATTSLVHTGLAKTVHDAATSLPHPGASSGTTPAAATVFDPWPPEGAREKVRGLHLDVSVDTDVTIPGPVWAVGHVRDGSALAWRDIGQLDGGASIVLGAGRGRVFELYDVAAWADSIRLYTASALTGAGKVTVTAAPLELQGPS